MIGFYDYTVVLTYMSLASALLGIFSAMSGNILYSVICLLFSGLCDMFDGRVARSKKNRTNDEKNYGIQIDSLSDLVAFGVLPAVIGYQIGIKGYAVIALIFFTLAALIRLAYFNVLQTPGKANKEYVGLPVTSSALIFPLLYGLKFLYKPYFTIVYCCFIVFVGLLFILNFRLKKPGKKAMMIMVIAGIIELLIILFRWR